MANYAGAGDNGNGTWRNAIARYSEFFAELHNEEHDTDTPTQVNETNNNNTHQQISLERDMQAAIRANIGQLEQGLTISNGGRERKVETGYIDIIAKDVQGTTVVIELKAGTAGQSAVSQIFGYMGSVMGEEGIDNV